MWPVLLLLTLFAGCAGRTIEQEVYAPEWTPERKAFADSVNQLGRAMARNGYVGPPPPLPMLPPAPMYCTSYQIGFSVSTVCD